MRVVHKSFIATLLCLAFGLSLTPIGFAGERIDGATQGEVMDAASTGVAVGEELGAGDAVDEVVEEDLLNAAQLGEEAALQTDATPVQAATVNPTVITTVHVQNDGWKSPVTTGVTAETSLDANDFAGTTGRSLRVEAFKIALGLVGTGYEGSHVYYNTHIQDQGWECNTWSDPCTWKFDDAISGTSGLSRRCEAIQIALDGPLASVYDIYYRVHVQNYGWLDWASNGAVAGTSGRSLRMEAVQIVLVVKDGAAPGDTEKPYVCDLVSYEAHVQDIGWMGAVADGTVAGTMGRGLRVEALTVALGNVGCEGSVRYRAHVQNVGWQPWAADGAVAGTTGSGLRLEAIQIELVGDVANHYDIYYCVHIKDGGWLDWASNGGTAGSMGISYRVEAVQIELVQKDPDSGTSAAPGACDEPCWNETSLLKHKAEGLGVSLDTAGFDQLVFVDSSGTSAQVYFFDRGSAGELAKSVSVATASGFVGSNGVGQATEWVPTTPQGLYNLPFAFGIAPNPGTAMEYHGVTRNSVWVDDYYSGYYNTWQEDRSYSGEVLCRYTDAYKYSIVIGYNYPGYLGVMRNGAVPGAGSAFFLHCSLGSPTAGCVSVPESVMISILRWVQPSKDPHILIV